jgi:predicted nucleotidyltransferase
MPCMSASEQLDLDAQREDLARLCTKFGVRRLDLFGSAATGAFDPAHSDVDLLVEFEAQSGMTPFDQYFGLREALAALLGREVDLVMEGASQNRYFLESVNKSRRLLYAA